MPKDVSTVSFRAFAALVHWAQGVSFLSFLHFGFRFGVLWKTWGVFPCCTIPIVISTLHVVATDCDLRRIFCPRVYLEQRYAGLLPYQAVTYVVFEADFSRL